MSVICYDGNDTIFHLIDQNLLQGRRNLEGRAIFEIMLTQNELLFDQTILRFLYFRVDFFFIY